jgi:hypothetical protein
MNYLSRIGCAIVFDFNAYRPPDNDIIIYSDIFAGFILFDCDNTGTKTKDDR